MTSSNYVPDCVACGGSGGAVLHGGVMGTGVCVECMGTGKWSPGALCPCGCGVSALKITKRGHVKGCKCRPCLGARNRQKGQRAQRNAHRALGGTGNTPTNEEWGAGYDITLHVQPEVKKGEQVPKSFGVFVNTEWLRRAMRQAEMASAPGTRPTVYIELPGDTIGWLVAKVKR